MELSALVFSHILKRFAYGSISWSNKRVDLDMVKRGGGRHMWDLSKRKYIIGASYTVTTKAEDLIVIKR